MLKKAEKAVNEPTHTSRKRRGNWTRQVRMIEIAGIGQVPATIVRVEYDGKVWEVPDTKEGRQSALDHIHAMMAHQAAIQRLERVLAVVQTVGETLTADGVDLHGTAVAALRDLIEAMKVK